ncbi:alternative ribosome rescue aminoacyl-tRNA hydrolase ArfB [soil metagenome]
MVTDRLTIPDNELSWRFSRASGPGGQAVNTTDSRVELSWDLEASTALSDRERDRALRNLRRRLVDGVVTVVASERRSQLRNRETAMARLATLVADAVAPPAPPRRPTRPSKAAQRRRMDDKKRRGDTKRLRRPPKV